MIRRLRHRVSRSRTPRTLVAAKPGPEITFTFDGRPVTALRGQSLAAALWAAGIIAWRTTRTGGRPRGVFCGIGQCFDCLVTVDGRPNRRACLVPAGPGDVVTTQEGHGRAALDADQ
jgi:predicted molibdopterin-dependent oxidoreductase YjgC